MTYDELKQKIRSESEADGEEALRSEGIYPTRFRGVMFMDEQSVADNQYIKDESRSFTKWISELLVYQDNDWDEYERNLAKRMRKFFRTFNKYAGKKIVAIRARQGGGNRKGYPIDRKNPRDIDDVDDYVDDTYCVIFYDYQED